MLRLQDAGETELFAIVAGRAVERGQSLGLRELHLGARFDDSQERGLQVKVAGGGLRLEPLQLRILELPPPEGIQI
jgi:hypothetical protein